MTYKWEELTVPDFLRVAEETQHTCIIPFGVLEKHGNHLPLGTDVLFSQYIAENVATQEPVIIFPTLYFGQINEAKHFPGTIAIKYDLMFALLENICEEIARNGIKKIVLLNGHGGNEAFIANFMLTMLEKPRDYILYAIRLAHYFSPVLNNPEWKEQMVSEFDEHAGEVETSVILYTHPELVKMDAVATGVKPLKRLEAINASTPIDWYADFPDHYAGDATHATAKKGEFLMTRFVNTVAETLKKIKADTETTRLMDEFYARNGH